MQRIAREQARKYAFDWRDEPLLRVKPAESFEIETYDASTGYFRTPEDLAIPAKRPGFDKVPPLANPIGGPVWIEGAERGDTLVVSIEDILVDGYSWIAVGPRRGPLGESARWPELSGRYTTKIFRHTPGPSGTTRDGTLHFSERISWPITPFIGTIGVAPEREVTTSLDGQGEWGGNLDIRDVAPGHRISLPVFHEGARFYLGDVHASQGDTEFTGTAAETKSTVRLHFDLVKGRTVPWMRIEKPTSIVSVFAYRPLEVAVETATINLIDWLVTDHGYTATDAYCLVSTCPDFRINVYQMCRVGKLSYVAGAELPEALPLEIFRVTGSPIGASPRRKEDVALLLGRGRYLDDLRRSGTAHLGVVRSVHAHARIRAIDATQARSIPGVSVFTAADLPEVARGIPAAFGATPSTRPYVQAVLAPELVRYVGEPVAVVVADDPYRLGDAMDLVVVDYDPLPPVMTPETAASGNGRVHDSWPDNAAAVARGGVGDVDRAVPSADVVVEERLRHPRLGAAPIEPRGVLAYRDAESGLLVVWSSTQNPYLVRDAVSVVLGLSAEEVRVQAPDVGGGFGPKGCVYHEDILVPAVALRLGRPVKWVEGRREHFVATGHDREQVHAARIALRRDGTIVAVEDAFLADVGAYPVEGTGLTLNTVNHMPGPYRVPNYRSVGTSYVTNKTQNAAYRGAGRPEAVFVMERLLDIGARRLGLDPIEVRRKNLVQPGEMPYRPGITYKDGVTVAYDPGDFPAALERALELLHHKELRAQKAAQAGTARRIGLGVACYVQGSGIGPYEGAQVRVDPSGQVFVTIGVAAQGQGHQTTLGQICAAELGVNLEDVHIVAGDTQLFPIGMGTGGSRVAANAGPAVARTAREVRARAQQVAAELLECAPEDVRIEAGRAFVAGVPGRAVTLGRVAHAAIRSKALRKTGEPGLQRCSYFYPDTVTWASGTQAAAVEVDLETCGIRLLAYSVVHDSGRAINPVIVEGQLQGGAAQGIGAGLWEELVYDGSGQLVTGSFMDYGVPKADQLPMLPVARVDHPSVVNELGIKGVGESGAIPGAAAIANAVEDAVADLGVTIREVPVTPARLFALLDEARLHR